MVATTPKTTAASTATAAFPLGEFVDLHSNYAFLFDAVSCMVKSNTEMDPVVVDGLSSLSWQMKRQAGELKEEFLRLHEKSRELEASCKRLH